MAENIHCAVFENGELLLSEGVSKGCDIVLAVPLSRILVKILKIPVSEMPSIDEIEEKVESDYNISDWTV